MIEIIDDVIQSGSHETELQSSGTSSSDWFASYILAGHPDTPRHTLAALSSDHRRKIRMRVAENILTPLSILVKLALDRHEDVRLAVAENPRIPRALLEHLAGDESADVRYALSENPNIPGDILQRLCLDENPYVACRAGKTLSLRGGGKVQKLAGSYRSQRRISGQT